MKRVITLILALTMLFSLTACGGKTSEPETTAAPAQQEAPAVGGEEAAAPAEKAPEEYVGTLKIWSAWNEDSGTGLWAEKFNEVYPNIKLEFTAFSNSGEGNIQLDTAIMGGEVDIVFNFDTKNVEARANAGMLYDLTAYLEEAGLDSVENWGLEDKYGDMIAAIPMGGNTDYVIINKDMWDAAGLGEIPDSWTLEEYYEAARAMTKVDAKGNVEVYGCSNYQSIHYWTIFVRGFLGDDFYYNADGTSSLDNQAWRDALEANINAELVEKIQYPLITYRDEGIQAYTTFYEGKVAMSTMVPAMTRRIANTDDYDFDFEITYAPMPTLYADQETNYASGVYYFSHVGIANNCEDPELAWQLLKWFSTEGSKYYANVGHLPTWKKNEPADILKVSFGTVEKAAELVDVDAYKQHVLNFSNPVYIEYNTTAASQLGTIMNAETMEAFRGNKTVDEALVAMKTQMDAAIAEASK